MAKQKIKTLFSLLMLFYFKGHAQSMLSLDDAIALAMKNNFDISIAKNLADISANNVSPGNAGMMPSLSLNADVKQSLTNTHLVYASGDVTDRNNAASGALGAGLDLNWTLFDGLKMFATYNQLKVLESKGITDLNIAIQNSLVEVMGAYYNISYQKELLRVFKTSDSVSTWRLNLTKTKFDVGSGSKLDFLQASVDKNATTSFLLQQQMLYENAKVKLNVLLGRAVHTAFEVSDSFGFNSVITYDELQQSAYENNPALLSADQDRQIFSSDLKMESAGFYPRLSLAAGYDLNRSTSQAGFVLSNQTLGPYVGLSLSWNIFNGRTQQIKVQNARINILLSNLQYEKIKTELDGNLLAAFNEYQMNRILLQLEEDNAALAKENLNLAISRFELGSSNALDLKNAQQSYEEQQSRLYSAKYHVKLSELQLLQLMGKLVVK